MTELQPQPVVILQREEITHSLTNRKTFEKVKLQELSDSIREKGVIQSILVRPVECIEDEERRKALLKAGIKFEIVFGERRWRGTKMADRLEIPAMVRNLTDREARALQLIENVQRADLHSLDEADQFHGLLESGDATVEEIAAEIGKGKSAVYVTLSFRKLPKEIKDAFRADQVSAAVAALLARISNPIVALEAGRRILKGRQDGQPFTVAEAKQILATEFMTVLKDAPFDPKDAELVPKAGACAGCPKRTGNQNELFGDVARKDTCTDPICFRLKCEAARTRRLEQAKKDGKIVLSKEDSEEFFYPYNGAALRYDAPVIELTSDCVYCPQNSWGRVVMELPEEARPQVIVAIDRNGAIRELIGRKEAEEAAEALEIIPEPETQRELSPEEVNQRRIAKAARERYETTKREVDLAVTAIIEKQGKAKDMKALFAFLRLLAKTEANFDTKRKVAKRHGFTNQKQDGDVQAYFSEVEKKADSSPVAFFLETFIWKTSLYVQGGLPEMVKAVSKIYGIDTKKIAAAAKVKPIPAKSTEGTHKK